MLRSAGEICAESLTADIRVASPKPPLSTLCGPSRRRAQIRDLHRPTPRVGRLFGCDNAHPVAKAKSAGRAQAAAIQTRLVWAVFALREKVSWLATPKADTREFLARALARVLLIAATGDLDRLVFTASTFDQVKTLADTDLERMRDLSAWE
jgi:hypothetical protein